ncbi:Protein phosphatase PP2A regulatory subunit B [Actinomortierella ambigua]|nr:Protein phosphatase PP2A regulatory subunit B [Actinomortierella ambigua]
MAGLVGYLGYEMKRESLEGYHVPEPQQCSCQAHGQPPAVAVAARCTCDCSRDPDATFLLATQAIVFDHQERQMYVLGIVDRQLTDAMSATSTTTTTSPRLTQPIGFTSEAECRAWLDHVSAAVTSMARASNPRLASRRRSSVFGVGAPVLGNGTERGVQDNNNNINGNSNGKEGHHTPYAIKQRQRRQSSASLVSPFKINFTESDYLDAIHKSLEYIHEGESYEICMTSQFRATIPLEALSDKDMNEDEDDQQDQVDQAFELYKILRRLNPAPFSTFLSYPTNNTSSNRGAEAPSVIDRQLILGSSPERFIRLGQKPQDEVVGPNPPKRESSRTVEMKPIKGTVAVAKGCFCSEDEGCSLDMQSEEDNSHGHDDGEEEEEEDEGRNGIRSVKNSTAISPSLVLSERRSRKDMCEDARKREDLRRIETLESNVKERAENLMIVDLIRNDLAHVCTSHSVRVPYLMRVESYETVHQLVTTVRGELRPGVNGAQAIKACFPPGSMTGAPKLRSVQLLDELERHQRRGVYSGCLGYIGFSAIEKRRRRPHRDHHHYGHHFHAENETQEEEEEEEEEIVHTGCDMSVVIRSAVLNRSSGGQALPAPCNGSAKQANAHPAHVMGSLSVGAGGALTILSDPQEEWREVVLKSRSVVPSVMAYLRQRL